MMPDERTHEVLVAREFARIIGKHVWEEVTDDAMIDEIIERIPKFKTTITDYYRITDMWYEKDSGYLYVKTARPGIIIGVKGANIDAISEKCKKLAEKRNWKFTGIKLKEDLYPLEEDLLEPMNSYFAARENY
jgi:ribosomal protein S3